MRPPRPASRSTSTCGVSVDRARAARLRANSDPGVALAPRLLEPELRDELLPPPPRPFATNKTSWEPAGDATWHRRTPGPGERPRNMQLEIAELHTARAASEGEVPAAAQLPAGAGS